MTFLLFLNSHFLHFCLHPFSLYSLLLIIAIPVMLVSEHLELEISRFMGTITGDFVSVCTDRDGWK